MSEMYLPKQISSFEIKTFLTWTGDYVKGLIIPINPDEYNKVEFYAGTTSWVNEKKGEWGDGAGNTIDDPKYAQRTGTLGEIALGKLLGLPVNLKYEKYGKPNDFILPDDETKVEIKTNHMRFAAGLVRATYDLSDRRIPLTSDIFVCATVEKENRKHKTATVAIFGWQTKDFVNQQYLCPAKIRTGGWNNVQLFWSALNDMDDLIHTVNDMRKNSNG